MWGTRPLTERYNNPGALEYQSWMEKYGARLGPNGRYAAFDSPDAGYGVMSKVLDTYQNKHGLNTVAGIVNRWAPSSVDNNSTGTYTQKVAAALGVDPNAPLSPEQRPALMRAMASYESGREAPSPNGLSPASNGQQPMRNPWLGLNWPTDGNAQAGDLNPGMTPGTLLAARLGASGMFDQVLPDGMNGGAAPPMPPMRGPQGMADGGQGPRQDYVSRETPSEDKPSLLDTILQRAQTPGFQGGMMMFLDAARGGSGIDGYKAGIAGGASMQETMMKDLALKQRLAQEKALKGLLNNNPKMFEDVPQPIVETARITGDMTPVLKYAAENEHTKNIQEFKFYQKNGFKGTFQDFMATKPNGVKHGLVPIPYQKPDGTTGYMVSNTAGDTKDLLVPGGGKILPPASTYQTATDVITRDKFGNEIKRESKGVGEAERQKALGEAQGKAQVDLPGVEKHANTLTTLIENVENDPYLPNMVGAIGGRTPNVTEAAKNTQAKIDQLKGQAFVQAFKDMKGAGAITEQEGKSASLALTRLQEQIVKGEDYRKVLTEFKNEVTALRDLKRAQARGVGGASMPAPSPSGGGWSIQRIE